MGPHEIVELQSKSPAAGVAQQYDAPNHPSDGLLRAYLIRVICNITSADLISPTYAEYRDTLFPTWFPQFQIFAPRYNKQICAPSLDGGFWAKMYEDAYGEPMRIRIGGNPVDQDNSVEISAVSQAVVFDFVVCGFETPKLGVDRLYTCPPASLFRGDVALKAQWAATQALRGINVTLDTVQMKWHVLCAYGNNARMPIIHSWERKEIGNDSVDLGSAFPAFITDNRVPSPESDAIRYNLFRDGEAEHVAAVSGDDLMASYQITNKHIVPEQDIYTPLWWIPEGSGVDDLAFADRSLTIKLSGTSSMTLDVHLMEPASQAVREALKSALGLSKATPTKSPPEAPRTAVMGNVNHRVANNGPRTLAVATPAGFVPPAGVSKTLPTVPSGTLGIAVANSLRPRQK